MGFGKDLGIFVDDQHGFWFRLYLDLYKLFSSWLSLINKTKVFHRDWRILFSLFPGGIRT